MKRLLEELLLKELRRFIDGGHAPLPPLDTAPTLSALELLILESLIDHPDPVASIIGARTGMKKGSTYITIGRMEDKGLLSSSTENGCRQYRITTLGQRLYRAELVYRAARAIALEGRWP